LTYHEFWQNFSAVIGDQSLEKFSR